VTATCTVKYIKLSLLVIGLMRVAHCWHTYMYYQICHARKL